MDEQQAGAILRLLETDYLLGIRHVPLRMSPPAPAVAAAGGSRASVGRPVGQPVGRTASDSADAGRSSSVPRSGGPGRPAASGRSVASPRSAAAAAPASGPVAENHPRTVRLDLPAGEYKKRFAALRNLDDKQVKACRNCPLCETRTKTVFGQGDSRTRLVFVGEAPGADEDEQGLAFVGKAGQLLTRMIEAMGISREWVFICNILKCRPPGNATPTPEQIHACWPYLDEQLRLIRPEVIVALGRPASQTLLRTEETIGRLRGVWHEYFPSGTPGEGEPIALMPTYHPSYLLRCPSEKVKTWSDLQQAMARLNLTPPGKAAPGQ